MLKSFLMQAFELWGLSQLQELFAPFRILSSISGIFWMLALLAAAFMAALRRLLPEDLSDLLSIVYFIGLSIVYATMMYYTALQGHWHPSLLWRQILGFVFMYVILGVTFTDHSTKSLKPLAAPGFFLGSVAYLVLAVVPALARQPVLAECHRVLELFSTGGWGNIMTVLTVLLMAWSMLSWAAFEIAFSLSPLLHRLRLIKAPLVRFDKMMGHDDEGRPVQSFGMVASLRRSWLVLSLLVAGACMIIYCWPTLHSAVTAASPVIQSRVRSPEAAEAATRLRRVLPEVAFTAVRALPRQGLLAALSRPVFRRLLCAPDDVKRRLAAAALDRVDPGFRISPFELFRSTAAKALPCVRNGQAFQLLMMPLPGDDPDMTRTYWVFDDHGVHFSGLGPGEFQEVSGSSGCAAAAFGSTGRSLLLAFTEAAQAPGAAPRLWLAAYAPDRGEVLAAARVGENISGDFELSATEDGVSWADAVSSAPTTACRRDCGTILGTPVLSLTTMPLKEYLSAGVADGELRVVPRSDLTFAHSGLDRNFTSLRVFELTFRFDPDAGFLNRWYTLARLADGRQCVRVAFGPLLPDWEQADSWACDQ
ncbi:MAG: hypothetical protein WCW52_09430 [Elusimicrobiales bacterium]|jgi:hypothetical protein